MQFCSGRNGESDGERIECKSERAGNYSIACGEVCRWIRFGQRIGDGAVRVFACSPQPKRIGNPRVIRSAVEMWSKLELRSNTDINYTESVTERLPLVSSSSCRRRRHRNANGNVSKMNG